MTTRSTTRSSRPRRRRASRYSGAQNTSSYAAFARCDPQSPRQPSAHRRRALHERHQAPRPRASRSPISDTSVVTTRPICRSPRPGRTRPSAPSSCSIRRTTSCCSSATARASAPAATTISRCSRPSRPRPTNPGKRGIKGDVLDHRLDFSLTAYRNDYANLQLRAGVPTGGAIITNAAEALIKGLEFEVTLEPVQGTRLMANTALHGRPSSRASRRPSTSSQRVRQCERQCPAERTQMAGLCLDRAGLPRLRPLDADRRLELSLARPHRVLLHEPGRRAVARRPRRPAERAPVAPQRRRKSGPSRPSSPTSTTAASW